MRMIYKWSIYVRFAQRDNNDVGVGVRYTDFKRRMLQSIPSCKESSFDDRNLAFYKVIDRPSEMFDYFYALNPMPGDTILDGATATIERVHVASDDKVVARESRKRRGRYPWGDKKPTNKTGPIVEGGAKND